MIALLYNLPGQPAAYISVCNTSYISTRRTYVRAGQASACSACLRWPETAGDGETLWLLLPLVSSQQTGIEPVLTEQQYLCYQTHLPNMSTHSGRAAAPIYIYMCNSSIAAD